LDGTHSTGRARATTSTAETPSTAATTAHSNTRDTSKRTEDRHKEYCLNYTPNHIHQDVPKAFQAAFLSADRQLCQQVGQGGTTAVVTLLKDGNLWVAHIGVWQACGRICSCDGVCKPCGSLSY
jgi:serine/threonine protein phosphatase PrpC